MTKRRSEFDFEKFKEKEKSMTSVYLDRGVETEKRITNQGLKTSG